MAFFVEIPKENQIKLGEWLEAKSKEVASQTENALRVRANSKYTGVIKFIDKVGGKVLYKPPHTHIVTLKEIPREISLDGYSTYQTQGLAEALNLIGIYPYLNGLINAFVFY